VTLRDSLVVLYFKVKEFCIPRRKTSATVCIACCWKSSSVDTQQMASAFIRVIVNPLFTDWVQNVPRPGIFLEHFLLVQRNNLTSFSIGSLKSH
jgi:hypothetical protein